MINIVYREKNNFLSWINYFIEIVNTLMFFEVLSIRFHNAFPLFIQLRLFDLGDHNI